MFSECQTRSFFEKANRRRCTFAAGKLALGCRRLDGDSG
jgi:hypothetical protein